MKHSLFGLVATLALIIGTTSCSDENEATATGGERNVSFTVSLPSGIQTRSDGSSYGDGTKATKLSYAVYDAEAEGIKLITYDKGTVKFTDKQATVELKLVTGKTYDILFWADVETNSPYTFNENNQTVTVDYTNAVSNDDNRDAFFKHEQITVTGKMDKTIELTRPFAQVNFGANDLEEDAVKEIVGSIQTKVTVANTYNTLNLKTGKVSGEAKDVVFGLAALPSSDESGAFPVQNYSYVSMNYLLVPTDQETADLTLSIYADETSENPLNEVKAANVPVQRNYRTNIYGQLLTSSVNYTLIIEPTFNTPDNNVEISYANNLTEANTLFAKGETNVVVSTIAADETEVILPSTTEQVNLTLPAIDENKTITITYATAAEEGGTAEKPATFILTAEGVNITNSSKITIELDASHVEVNGIAVSEISAKTSAETLVIGADAKVGTLTVSQGAIEIYGEVGTLTIAEGATCPVNVWAVGDKDTWKKAYDAGAKTIELKNDIEDFDAAIPVGRDLVINGKGHTIKNVTTSSSQDKKHILVINKENVNVAAYDTHFIMGYQYGSGFKFGKLDEMHGGAEAKGSSLTLDNCTIDCTYYAIIARAGSENVTVNIKNGSYIKGWCAFNLFCNKSTINVENSTLHGYNFTEYTAGGSNDYSTIIIDGAGATSHGQNAQVGDYGVNNTLNITDSKIICGAIENGNNQHWLGIQYGASIGNKITIENTEIVNEDGMDYTWNFNFDNRLNSSATETYDVTDTYIIVDKKDITYQAEINGTKYLTLQEALDAVTEGQTVSLLRDVTSNTGFLFSQNVAATFDLGGHTLKVTADTENNHRALKIASGTLTVTNGTIDARNVNAAGQPEAFNKTSSENYTDGIYGTVRVEGSATAILDGLTLYNNHCWGMSVKPVDGTAKVELKNCTLNSEVGGGIEVAGGTTSISNCTFNQTGTSNYANYVSCAIAVSYGGTANVTDTNVSAEALTPLYVFSSGGTINIAGGTYVGRSTETEPKVIQADVDLTTYPEAVAAINISGGTFTGKISKTDSEKATVSITGGTFSVDPTAYLAEGCTATQSNGVWTVSKK